MADADDLLCWECVSDEVLRSWIRENGHAGKCVFCGKRRVATALSDVAEKIDDVIREFYRPSKESAHVVPDSDIHSTGRTEIPLLKSFRKLLASSQTLPMLSMIS